MKVKAHGPILITAELEARIRQRLGKVREEAKTAALNGFPTVQERMHGQEDALMWVLRQANTCEPEKAS